MLGHRDGFHLQHSKEKVVQFFLIPCQQSKFNWKKNPQTPFLTGINYPDSPHSQGGMKFATHITYFTST